MGEPVQLSLGFAEADGRALRAAPRERAVRLAEYGPLPGPDREESALLGLTRDRSLRGLCLAAHHEHPPGALLRVALRGLDGALGQSRVARVAWCEPAPGSRHWLGLELLAAVLPRRERHAPVQAHAVSNT